MMNMDNLFRASNLQELRESIDKAMEYVNNNNGGIPVDPEEISLHHDESNGDAVVFTIDLKEMKANF